ncbi:YjbE family putative metal transport protein [Polymorphobacter fuscus]|uniref:YjbE family putative metal transport protein n=1 Tax=Sandarakinorhabdus fusca TaxID=1439888 RepID=A0A7C9KJ57_9SPHN|nr:YjbE family putative metal transport protein [Polymorphobacter fuscus]KAB7644809.1 YjbE family putative metal transport protein [Polymorphobacter fuscus]MQT18080.1 YjbE family putative metal transport protein [Polymorphobacter fuscus]NJC09398.1 YjbE family integral membrane protein [Polymorphobacter fuscus]
MDFANIFAPGALAILLQVVMIDVVLAGDNAIVVGSLAAGLPPHERKKVIAIGIAAALVLRIVFALLVTQLMQIVGLVLAGGLLLLWVSWRMYRDLRPSKAIIDVEGADDFESVTGPPPAKSFAAAAWSVAIADVSMSLDNVLAVAGAAREHPEVMIIGLVVSVAMMGIAANFIAKYIERYRWIAYVGLAVIVYVAIKMIVEGWHQVAPVVQPLVG